MAGEGVSGYEKFSPGLYRVFPLNSESSAKMGRGDNQVHSPHQTHPNTEAPLHKGFRCILVQSYFTGEESSLNYKNSELALDLIEM